MTVFYTPASDSLEESISVLSQTDSFDEDVLSLLLSEVITQNKSFGVLSSYHAIYYYTGDQNLYRIALIPSSYITHSMLSLLLVLALIFTVAMGCFLLVSIRLSKVAVRPMEEAMQREKQFVADASHDLKTPLTAIITYTDLLKDENLTLEKRREYLDTLERKSLRLKVLIEDLFEVSKANSKNVQLNIMNVDILNLVKQVALEMSDKLDSAHLDVRMNFEDKKVILPLDSQKTFRIYENLFGNISKYAMPGTRVYADLKLEEDTVDLSLKNVSEHQLNISADELTERFIRGDLSRSSEGSGLGLSIAQSLTTMQGGTFNLYLDGDLFRVNIRFPRVKKQ